MEAAHRARPTKYFLDLSRAPFDNRQLLLPYQWRAAQDQLTRLEAAVKKRKHTEELDASDNAQPKRRGRPKRIRTEPQGPTTPTQDYVVEHRQPDTTLDDFPPPEDTPAAVAPQSNAQDASSPRKKRRNSVALLENTLNGSYWGSDA